MRTVRRRHLWISDHWTLGGVAGVNRASWSESDNHGLPGRTDGVTSRQANPARASYGPKAPPRGLPPTEPDARTSIWRLVMVIRPPVLITR